MVEDKSFLRYRKAIQSLIAQSVPAGKSLDEMLEELAEKWNPLFDLQGRRNLVEDVNALVRVGFPRFRGQCNMPLGHRVAPVFGGCPDTNPPRKIALRPATRLAFPRCLLSDLIRPPVRRLSAQTHAA